MRYFIASKSASAADLEEMSGYEELKFKTEGSVYFLLAYLEDGFWGTAATLCLLAIFSETGHVVTG